MLKKLKEWLIAPCVKTKALVDRHPSGGSVKKYATCLRLVDFEGTLCCVISGISIEQIEQNPELAQTVKLNIKRLIQANRDIGWHIILPGTDKR